MSTLKDVTLRIPKDWDAEWFRVFVVEFLAKADVRAALGIGVTITADGNSVATLSVSPDASIAAHNADPFAHPGVIDAHKAEADPHPQYLQDAPVDGNNYVRKDGAWVSYP